MRVELLKAHTHAGITYAPLSVIVLDADVAKWLIDAGVARAIVMNATSAKAAITTTTSATSATPFAVDPNTKPFSRNEEKSK